MAAKLLSFYLLLVVGLGVVNAAPLELRQPNKLQCKAAQKKVAADLQGMSDALDKLSEQMNLNATAVDPALDAVNGTAVCPPPAQNATVEAVDPAQGANNATDPDALAVDPAQGANNATDPAAPAVDNVTPPATKKTEKTPPQARARKSKKVTKVKVTVAPPAAEEPAVAVDPALVVTPEVTVAEPPQNATPATNETAMTPPPQARARKSKKVTKVKVTVAPPAAEEPAVAVEPALVVEPEVTPEATVVEPPQNATTPPAARGLAGGRVGGAKKTAKDKKKNAGNVDALNADAGNVDALNATAVDLGNSTEVLSAEGNLNATAVDNSTALANNCNLDLGDVDPNNDAADLMEEAKTGVKDAKKALAGMMAGNLPAAVAMDQVAGNLTVAVEAMNELMANGTATDVKVAMSKMTKNLKADLKTMKNACVNA